MLVASSLSAYYANVGALALSSISSREILTGICNFDLINPVVSNVLYSELVAAVIAICSLRAHRNN